MGLNNGSGFFGDKQPLETPQKGPFSEPFR